MSLRTVYVRELPGIDVLVVAAPFGLGPRVSADEMLSELGVRASAWVEVEAASLRGRSTSLLLDFGVFGTDWPALDFGTRVWIDCLMWGRLALPEGVASADIVIAEQFFPASVDAVAMCRSFVEVVPPTRPAQGLFGRPIRDAVFVSFGGIATPFSNVPWLVAWLASIVAAVARAVPVGFEVVCGVPEPLATTMRNNLGAVAGVQVVELSNQEVGEQLATCRVAVLQAGLYAPFTAMALGTPTVFVPPFSYTQHLQSLRFRQEGWPVRLTLLDALTAEVGEPPQSFGSAEAQSTRSLEDWWAARLTEISSAVAADVLALLDAERRSWIPHSWAELPALHEIVGPMLAAR